MKIDLELKVHIKGLTVRADSSGAPVILEVLHDIEELLHEHLPGIPDEVLVEAVGVSGTEEKGSL